MKKALLIAILAISPALLGACDKVKQPDPKPTVSQKLGTASSPDKVKAGCEEPTPYVIMIKRANGVEALRCISAADYEGTLVGDVFNGAP